MLLTVTIYNNRNERGKATSPDNREDTGRNRGQCQWSGGPGPEDTHTHSHYEAIAAHTASNNCFPCG